MSFVINLRSSSPFPPSNPKASSVRASTMQENETRYLPTGSPFPSVERKVSLPLKSMKHERIA